VDIAGGSSEARRGAVAQGLSEQLLTNLYRAEITRLRKYLSRLLRSDAEADDVAQDAFLRLHRRSELQTYGCRRAVLFKTAYRLALNRVRARRSNPLDRADELRPGLEPPCDMGTTTEQDLIAKERESAVKSALEHLPPRCRQVIELRTVQELSFREISDTLGLSVSTLEKHLVKGKRDCAQALAGQTSPVLAASARQRDVARVAFAA